MRDRDVQRAHPPPHLVPRVPRHPPQLVHGHGVETLAEDGPLHLDWAAVPGQHKGTLLCRRCHLGITQQKLATWWSGRWCAGRRVGDAPDGAFLPISGHWAPWGGGFQSRLASRQLGVPRGCGDHREWPLGRRGRGGRAPALAAFKSSGRRKRSNWRYKRQYIHTWVGAGGGAEGSWLKWGAAVLRAVGRRAVSPRSLTGVRTQAGPSAPVPVPGAPGHASSVPASPAARRT